MNSMQNDSFTTPKDRLVNLLKSRMIPASFQQQTEKSRNRFSDLKKNIQKEINSPTFQSDTDYSVSDYCTADISKEQQTQQNVKKDIISLYPL